MDFTMVIWIGPHEYIPKSLTIFPFIANDCSDDTGRYWWRWCYARINNCYSKNYNENPPLFTSISPGHLFPLYRGCHCPILDLNAAALLYHSIPSLFRCIVCKMYSRPGSTFSDEFIVWAAAEHSSTVSLDTGENTARCPGHCCVLRGHRLLCPGWTQPRRQSHCASMLLSKRWHRCSWWPKSSCYWSYFWWPAQLRPRLRLKVPNFTHADCRGISPNKRVWRFCSRLLRYIRPDFMCQSVHTPLDV